MSPNRAATLPLAASSARTSPFSRASQTRPSATVTLATRGMGGAYRQTLAPVVASNPTTAPELVGTTSIRSLSQSDSSGLRRSASRLVRQRSRPTFASSATTAPVSPPAVARAT
jgi:hypothetical protein